MAWLAVDYSGEFISDKKPFRDMFNIGYYGFISDFMFKNAIIQDLYNLAVREAHMHL